MASVSTGRVILARPLPPEENPTPNQVRQLKDCMASRKSHLRVMVKPFSLPMWWLSASAGVPQCPITDRRAHAHLGDEELGALRALVQHVAVPAAG